MRTVALILTEAGILPPGFHFHIENPPWMPLDIEDIESRGPFGFRSISVAHYDRQNGDSMRDPEMLFEMELRGGVYRLSPYYWRNDYLGIEQHSRHRDDEGNLLHSRHRDDEGNLLHSRHRDDEGNLLILACLQRRLEQFAGLWDNNLRSQGFVEAFRRSRKPNLPN